MGGERTVGRLQYVDDGAFAEPLLGVLPWITAELLEKGLETLLGEHAHNLAKERPGGDFGTLAVLVGLEVDTHDEAILLTQEKRT